MIVVENSTSPKRQMIRPCCSFYHSLAEWTLPNHCFFWVTVHLSVKWAGRAMLDNLLLLQSSKKQVVLPLVGSNEALLCLPIALHPHPERLTNLHSSFFSLALSFANSQIGFPWDIGPHPFPPSSVPITWLFSTILLTSRPNSNGVCVCVPFLPSWTPPS